MTARNLPASIKIFGQKYKVKYDLNSEENNGETEFDTNTISIRPGLPKDKLFRVLMHEVTHAIINETPLSLHKKFNEEEVCDIVGFHFIDTLKQNPKLLNLLLREMSEDSI